MAEIDYVIRSLSVKNSAVFKLEDIYKVLKSKLANQGYAISERDYNESGRKSIEIKFVCFKKVDDYSMFVIELKFKAKDLEHVEVKGHKLSKGEVEVKFESYIQSDYEDYWEEKGTSKFIRGVYDKFARKDKFEKYNDELKEDTYDVYNEVKSYLKLHVLK